ncbi:unnamed protein product [Porites evermanni]|uniref:ZMYM2-like/QRICH1 C-terminal domain-containing protein n=1 Tax=Porites evermanni TaxID=104178 RepID=A0ABN8RPQ5_9CNID|nr:unnamed protein product [Porites evermanni]
MYEDKSNADRCPVNTYLAYKEHRPTSMMTDESPFYLAVNNENPKPGQMWFKCSPLGVNSLRSMLKNMIRDSGLETDKRLVNHSTRKHLVQKLVDNDIPPNEIIQITGHKNVNSLNNYSSLSDKMLPVPAKACQPYLLKRIQKRKPFYRVQLREVYFQIAKSQR